MYRDMADEERIGKPWSDEELDAIVSDYFAMLTAELAGQSYVKSHHSAALMAEIGRTHRSVEFKHQNISAVMEELGLPWIQGYKPKRNYQNAIFDAIDRYLSASEVGALEGAPTQLSLNVTASDIFVDAPNLEDRIERPPKLEKLVRKFDPAERDFRNRKLGKAGEEFVVRLERQKLIGVGRDDLAENVRWVSDLDGDGAGYDVRSFGPEGQERLIEVKTTNGAAKTPFYLSRNEHETAELRPDAWRLYRVHLFAQRPAIFTLSPPLEATVHLRTESWRAEFA
jgi:hypothetical protein